MQVFQVQAEVFKRPKYCCHCQQLKDAGTKMYFGHTMYYTFKNQAETVENTHYTCENCVTNKQGYITECHCMERL